MDYFIFEIRNMTKYEMKLCIVQARIYSKQKEKNRGLQTIKLQDF